MGTTGLAAVGKLTLYPDAGLVPEMPADEYAAFLASVKARGVQKPLELVPGTTVVVDGRTRLRAAREAGLAAVPVADMGASRRWCTCSGRRSSGVT